MNKLNNLLLLICLFMSITVSAKVPKYIFYFIGDGMGLNQVNGTEMYLASLKGIYGVESLTFTKFPYVGMATTFSASSGVTDSAAAGTALATGHKTYNGAIGVSADTIPVQSIAVDAKRRGYKVGITSSCSLDDATPSVFYSHQKSREYGYEIASDLLSSEFDFFAGSPFSNLTKRMDGSDAPNLLPLMKGKGYNIVYGYKEYLAKAKDSEKVILLSNETEPVPVRIDRKEGDISLKQITQSAIQTLSKNNKNGFFLMVEAGDIDRGGHANDAGTCFREVIDLNEAVNVAMEFYNKHSDETLIVVTADHETGGIVIGDGYTNLQVLQYQKASKKTLSMMLAELRNNNKQVTWEQVKQLLSDNLGFWSKIKLKERQEKYIHDAYVRTFIDGDQSKDITLYQKDEKVSSAAIKVLNEIAAVGWTTGSHSAGYVPVFAIGQGAEEFVGKYDNTQIPAKIRKIAKFK
ncbi:alkaline phosphatase [Bacteroides uniformis]|uniref:alkaline phosphatase n=1 Tax=Bacteroides uniformis TaxID=820 RepID=UPI00319E662E